MYQVHFVASSEATHGLYNYTAIGSLSQVIEGARIKSFQVPMLKSKEWLVLFTQGRTTMASRTMQHGKII